MASLINAILIVLLLYGMGNSILITEIKYLSPFGCYEGTPDKQTDDRRQTSDSTEVYIRY